jgi:hypothetical protein
LSPAGGIGPVEFGMQTDQIVPLLGQPDWIYREETTVLSASPTDDQGVKGHMETLDYRSRGFRITVSSSPRVGMTGVHCFNQDMSGPMVRDFMGKTAEGIRLGASRDDVLKIYGKPDVNRRGRVSYLRRGWEFSFFNEKLCGISVNRPTPKEVEIRVLDDGSVLKHVKGAKIEFDEKGRPKGMRPVPQPGENKQ